MKYLFKYTVFFLVILFLMIECSYAKSTMLSQKAEQITYGMSLIESVKLLGVPGWLIFSTDESEFASDIPSEMFKLIWKNEACAPIVILVNIQDDKISGWDEGKSGCDGTGSKVLPDDRFSLKNEARYSFYESKVNVNITEVNIDYDLIRELEKERKRLNISWKLLEKDYASLNTERGELVMMKEALGYEPEPEALLMFEEKLESLNEKIEIYKTDKLNYEADLEKYNERADHLKGIVD